MEICFTVGLALTYKMSNMVKRLAFHKKQLTDVKVIMFHDSLSHLVHGYPGTLIAILLFVC